MGIALITITGGVYDFLLTTDTRACIRFFLFFSKVIIIIIALKGATQDVSISSLRHELSPTCTVKWPGRNPVQQLMLIMCMCDNKHV